MLRRRGPQFPPLRRGGRPAVDGASRESRRRCSPSVPTPTGCGRRLCDGNCRSTHQDCVYYSDTTRRYLDDYTLGVRGVRWTAARAGDRNGRDGS